MHAGTPRVRHASIAAVAAMSVFTTAPSQPGAAAPSRVIVSATAGVSAASDAVRAAGGRVIAELTLLGGVVADLPQGSRLPDGVTTAPDRAVSLRSGASEDAAATSTVRATLGLADSGNDGAGITVAVVDTGVADVPDLAGAVEHVDVSGSGAGDGYGHGTFMAGLIAGSGVSSGGAVRGVAPGARILDVKVADNAGNTALSVVLRGLEVVAAHPEVRVLNLSLSSDSPLPYQADPLTRALDALWARGIVVVVPAGNDGPGTGTVTSPGTDPNLLTVGGIDEAATPARGDDTVAAWSSRGPAPQGIAKPDVAAPGAHLISLRAPDSVIDAANPASRVGTSYFRGSGTSMATAVTAGAVAVLLAARPALRPSEAKALLTGTAYDAAGLGDPAGAGAGGIDVHVALTAPVPARSEQGKNARGPRLDLPTWMDRDESVFELFARAWSAGDYAAAARAWSALSPQARAWSARAWSMEVWAQSAALSDTEWEARAWSARAWSARAWSGTEWLARAWSARAWSGDDWAARAWSARAWSGTEWSARAWSARAWSARAWSARAWSAADFTDGDWSDAEWTARAWSARAWSARAWSARAWSARSWS